ncbi:MAG: phosphoenolpyruvate--protein phosphotransferase [Planctomycetes bacterium]|nr:phosphoenolpyruvate--protein phosphotransferase [Planctomycetota bacterium]
MLKGVALAPGVAVGQAFIMEAGTRRGSGTHRVAAVTDAELDRLDKARAKSLCDLEALERKVRQELGASRAAIFKAHRLLLEDPLLIGKVKSLVVDGACGAVEAVERTREEFIGMFQRVRDSRMLERIADIKDVFQRIIGHLDDPPPLPPVGGEPLVLVAEEILPSMAGVLLERGRFAAIVTETGGVTGHGAILARSLGIPAVSGARGILRAAFPGDLIAVDGREGVVHLRPGPEILTAYRKLAREYASVVGRLVENRDQPAVTACGQSVSLLANVNYPLDARVAHATGAAGVGLYRTEYLFLTHPSIPEEDEQAAAYRATIEPFGSSNVVIRTIDLGADKMVPWLTGQHEANPFMGYRSIRMARRHPGLFMRQLRAILRAAAGGIVNILFPMISRLEELLFLRRLLDQGREDLTREGIPHADEIRVGVLVEVPAIAFAIRSIVKRVDFISIGSNDLTQYLMAADRDNPKVAHLCQPYNPVLFRLVRRIFKAASRTGIPVTICGEMAGEPRCLLPLLGLGIRRFSMAAALLPSVKELLRRVTVEEAAEAARRVCRMSTFRAVRRYLTERTHEIMPDLNLIEGD